MLEASYINHSGGSPGADAAWRRAGERYGVETRSYLPWDDPAPEDPTSVVLSQAQLLEADGAILAADAALGAGFQELPPRKQNYVRRNAFQVRHAEGVFAVARIVAAPPGLAAASAHSVAGGTAWAFAMALQAGKPVYVFDHEAGCCDCSNAWHTFDYTSRRLVAVPSGPRLPHQFAGVGARDIGEAGVEAVQEVYRATFQH